MLYLATASTEEVRDAMRAGLLGQMTTPLSGNRLEPGVPFALDNGCYSANGWNETQWRRTLDQYADTPDCLFAVVPDVVANAAATDELWDRWAPVVRDRGYRPAYVLQNGCEQVPADAAAVFTGGDTAWKLGEDARRLVQEAQARGLWCHMGRVNNLRRLRVAALDGYDSVDGTYLAFGPDKNLPRLLTFLRLAARPTLFGQPMVGDGGPVPSTEQGLGLCADRHRQTAAEWHGGQSSPLYAYASTGTVVPGIAREIEDCLALVERGQLDAGQDPLEQHERLRALLHHVEPELAAFKAREIGREHGQNAAAWWQQEALGGRAGGDTASTTRRVLHGVEDGDPAILDVLPGPIGGYTATELSAECGWPEPSVDDRVAHDRWETAQPTIADAYVTTFIETLSESVVQACRNELADREPRRAQMVEAATPDQRTRPLLRLVGGSAEAPPGWVTVPAGRNSRGEDLEVVYDPGRYDVLVVHGERGGMFPRLPREASADLMLDALAVTGWEPHNFAGEPRVWIRNRAAAERIAFEHREAGKQPEVQFNDVGPTRPFLRPEGSIESIPPGWIAEPAGVVGTSSDVLVEIVYNPQRHDVMRVPKAPAEAALNGLADQGWTQGSSDSTSHLLWRDRIAHSRTALERSTARTAIGIEGPGL